MKRSDELKQQRSAVLAKMTAMHEMLKSEKRTMTSDEDKQWDKMAAEKISLNKSIDFEMSQEAAEARAAQKSIETGESKKKDGASLDDQKAEAREAIKAYFQGGKGDLSPEQRSLLFGKRGIMVDGEKRAQSAVTALSGAEMVREEYLNEFERHMAAHSGIMQSARILRTATGGTLPYPTVNDTSNKGRRIGENTAANTTPNIPTAQVVFNAYKYTSDGILVPNELDQDDSYGFVADIPSILSERIARIYNEEATTGTGTNMPTGIINAASDSTISVAAASLSRAKIVDLIFSVNAAYRTGGKLMFSDATLAAILKMAIGSADDRPLWIPSMREGASDRIEGYEYVVNHDMPELAAGNKAILFGDMKKYVVRLVRDFNVKRTDDRHIETDQTGFYGFSRMDGKAVNADAIKYLSVT